MLEQFKKRVSPSLSYQQSPCQRKQSAAQFLPVSQVKKNTHCFAAAYTKTAIHKYMGRDKKKRDEKKGGRGRGVGVKVCAAEDFLLTSLGDKTGGIKPTK